MKNFTTNYGIGSCLSLLFVGFVAMPVGCSETPPPTPEEREAMIERDRERSQIEMQQVRDASK